MTYNEIMAMPIENVEETELDNGSIFISFDLNRSHCWLEACLYGNTYEPMMIYFSDGWFCPFCNKEERTYCSKLEIHRKTIFERVIQCESIRLNWLFREYKFH